MFAIAFILVGLTCLTYCAKIRGIKIILDFILSVKKALAWIYLWHLKTTQKKLFRYFPNKKDVRKAGFVPTIEEWFYESPRQMDNNKPYLGDTVEFCGINDEGDALTVYCSRRHNRLAEAKIYLKLKSGDEYQSVIHPDMRICNTNPDTFSAGGLVLEVLEPLRTWRILFRGILRKGIHNDWSQDNDELVKVCFTFIWHPAYHHYVLNQNFNMNTMAEAISKRKLTRAFFNHFTVASDERYEQWGQMMGTLQIDNGEERKLNLWAPKIRSYGIQNWKHATPKLRIHLHTKEGTVVSLQSDHNHLGLKNVTHGYLVPASNFGLNTISKIDLDLENIFVRNSFPEDLTCTFTARKESNTFKIKAEKYGYRVFGGHNWDVEITSRVVRGTFNDEECVGFIEFSRPYEGTCPENLPRQNSLPFIKEIDIKCDKFVITMDEPACQNVNMVGGKGASLALMSSIKNSPEKCQVPPAVFLTTNAYAAYVKENSEISEAITKLQNIAWKLEDGCLKSQCEIVVNAIQNSQVPQKIQDEIKENLASVFDINFGKIQFAVRSSALGEDGDEISAAGQNETILGVFGLEQICEAILKCWASQFSYRATEYKRQNGQLINPGMCVVIQKMVPSDVSGVMFTGDPLTGAFGYITITANYGLGETVVSALSDPDTIILRRSWNDKLTILDKQIGTKSLKITLKSDGQGTEEQQTDTSEATRCTLSDDLTIKLGKLAVFLEQSYGGSRDIEWAVYNGEIFLLQCRPITTALQPNQYEIMHEFDTPRITDHEMFTRANVGEVMPGALSPLTISSLKKTWVLLNMVMMKDATDRFWYNPLSSYAFGMATYCNHFLSDQVHQKLFGLSKKISPLNAATQLGLYGRIIDDDQAHIMALKRYPIPGAWTNFKLSYEQIVKKTLFGNRILKNAIKKFGNYDIPLDGYDKPEDLYHKIEDCIFEHYDMTKDHVTISTASMIWNLFTLSALSSGSNEYTIDHYNDFAMMVGQGNGAISGDVPFSLKELVLTIKKEKSREEFTKMSVKDSLEWLTTGNSRACFKFQEFMQLHGHRGHKEYELSATSWNMEPKKLVKVLQTMVGAADKVEEVQPALTIEETLSKLKTPMTPMKKRFLSFVLPRCRKGVVNREQVKTMLIKTCYRLRLAFLKLGELMMKEGRIPDPRFILFLTHDEIGRLLTTRSARILNRAAQRRRLFPSMDSLHFREFHTGDPKAIEEEEQPTEIDTSSGTTTGYPVCQGMAKGPARVVLHIDNADQIQSGDILVTYSTDIAWSPYFPLLAGVVTEIGGLISHGAVVSREYGIPCIVGAKGATKVFQSGDMVILNANKGILSKAAE